MNRNGKIKNSEFIIYGGIWAQATALGLFLMEKQWNFLITVKKNYYLIFLILFINGKIYSYIGNRGEW